MHIVHLESTPCQVARRAIGREVGRAGADGLVLRSVDREYKIVYNTGRWRTYATRAMNLLLTAYQLRSRAICRFWPRLRRGRAAVALLVLLTLGLFEPVACILHCTLWLPHHQLHYHTAGVHTQLGGAGVQAKHAHHTAHITIDDADSATGVEPCVHRTYPADQSHLPLAEPSHMMVLTAFVGAAALLRFHQLHRPSPPAGLWRPPAFPFRPPILYAA